MFIISRLLLGLGIAFAIVAAPSLIGGKLDGAYRSAKSGHSSLDIELSHPKERARLGSIFNASWYTGAILVAGVTLGTFSRRDTWSWRIPSALKLLSSAFQLTFIWWVPESPRWLISKGRHEEARAILIKYHAEGSVYRTFYPPVCSGVDQECRDENSELAKAEFTSIEQTLGIEEAHAKRGGRRWWRLLVCASVSWLFLSLVWPLSGVEAG